MAAAAEAGRLEASWEAISAMGMLEALADLVGLPAALVMLVGRAS